MNRFDPLPTIRQSQQAKRTGDLLFCVLCFVATGLVLLGLACS